MTILRSSETPMTAYQILEALQCDEPDIAPPTVYRALTALTEQGRAHRLESLKSFVPCRCDHAQSLAVLTICETCGLVQEHDGGPLLPKLSSLIADTNFKPARHIFELRGQCGECSV
ncbi:Fur family transcriptional regulator [uncultured Roseobacter sp.]|uniref:Fur family transcriptional regulator n=1 Tax=uncultured Roseobacter sp. TaxID=114847 RepID=UPI002627260A|nr:transcriptional repressor [uncultured Roseobacter sp.]